MNVLLPITAFYPSQIGGPCNTVYWHACALTQSHINVRVITTDYGIKDGVIAKEVVLENESGSVFYSRKKLFNLKALRKINEGIKWADIIHLNSLFGTFSIYSFFYAKLFSPKKKIIWSVRGELNSNALKFSKKKKTPLLFFYRKMTKNIIFHSTSEKETQEIKSVFGDVNIVEVPNLIEPSIRLNSTVHNQFLYLGRIHPIKAVHKMIEGFAKSNSFMNSDFRLIIVGKHEERHQSYFDSLKELVNQLNLEHKIEWKGHLTGHEKEKVYSESYALVLPSETENFGNVVIESLNQGTPVIASKGTPWSVLEDYNCGFHIENSPFEIAKSIDELINLDEISYKELRNNAKTLVDQKFNVKKQINKWIKIYENENSK